MEIPYICQGYYSAERKQSCASPRLDKGCHNVNVRELIRDRNLSALATLAKDNAEQFDDRLWFPSIKEGGLEVCKLLVAAGVSPHRTRYDRTPLHMAAYEGDSDIVQWLTEQNVDPNAKDGEGYLPLDLAYHFAEDEPPRELVVSLLGAGTRIELETAVRMGDLARCEAILRDDPTRLETRSGMTLTPLMISARMNRQEIARYLITLGADVHAISEKQKNGDGGNTALWYSVQGSRTAREGMVTLLLEHGANVNCIGEHDWTPLHMAAQWNHPESAKILLRHGADLGCKDSDGRTSMDIARQFDSAMMVELLLSQ